MSRYRLFLCSACITVTAIVTSASPLRAQRYQDRFVWVFGWNLQKDSDVTKIDQVLETSAKHGINGAVLSAGIDSMSRQQPAYFRRLDHVIETCRRLNIELIPAGFSVGYGSAALGVNRNLAEGLPVLDAPFVVKGDAAQLLSDELTHLRNGGFEQADGQKVTGLDLQDQPGTVSFVDTQIKHGGSASLRMENFTANPYGHGRVMQKVMVRPRRCYRVSLWVKTEGLRPADSFEMLALANGRELAPRRYSVPATTDWRKLTMLVNSLDYESINLYAGVWGAKEGKFWLDDWAIEEVGPLNVLHRPGTPVNVRSDDGAQNYTEGKDYAPLDDDRFNFYNVDREATSLRILPEGRIKNGQKLRISWYHPMIVNAGQITVCIAEPQLYEIFDREARILAKHVHARRFLLNMDEIRMGGTCQACGGKDMGALLGECVSKEVAILGKYMPGVQVYIWSDMLDPNHNAHGNYYLVNGSFTGSWSHVPKDLTIAVWGGPARPRSLRFFADHGFESLVACYYDADNLDDVKKWAQLAAQTPHVRGFMYTTWQRKYQLLGDFADLLNAGK